MYDLIFCRSTVITNEWWEQHGLIIIIKYTEGFGPIKSDFMSFLLNLVLKLLCAGTSTYAITQRRNVICITQQLKSIYISNNGLLRCRVSSLSQSLMQWCCAEQKSSSSSSSLRLRCSRKVMMPQIVGLFFSMHFRVVTLLLAFSPFWRGGGHHTLNSNMCCCSALISSYKLYVNTVCHHRALLGSVSRVELMV